jgi:hypothetical protein
MAVLVIGQGYCELVQRAAGTFNHLLYYIGGMIAIGGISVFVTLAPTIFQFR